MRACVQASVRACVHACERANASCPTIDLDFGVASNLTSGKSVKNGVVFFVQSKLSFWKIAFRLFIRHFFSSCFCQPFFSPHFHPIFIGVWQGVAMNSLKFHPGPPCHTLLCPVGGPHLKRAYSRFRGGLSTRQVVGGLRPSSTHLDTPRRTPMPIFTIFHS
jgi:hypothetical protein